MAGAAALCPSAGNGFLTAQPISNASLIAATARTSCHQHFLHYPRQINTTIETSNRLIHSREAFEDSARWSNSQDDIPKLPSALEALMIQE